MKLKVEYTETIRREVVIDVPDEREKDLRIIMANCHIQDVADTLEGWVRDRIEDGDVVSDDEIDGGVGVIESIEELK